MITLDLSILNQKGTPMFYSDLTANIPAAGIAGRIFIATDSPYGIFRDTGSAWVQIAGTGGGGGGISGSGSATQIAFWTGATAISGSNNLWWDSTSSYLGINTNAPGNPLDVHGSISSVAALNQTTATNNTLLSLLNSGTPLWRIGNFYTSGTNDFGIFDVVGALQHFTILKSTGQTFIGAKTTAFGRLVINSATADAHLQIVGASSPSIRIDNIGSGATQRFAIGNATATNDFIQGSSAGQFCITTASVGAMLFGMWVTSNATEVMRITTTRNLHIGGTGDSGDKLQVTGTTLITGLTNSILTIKGGSGDGFNYTYLIFQNATNSRRSFIGQSTRRDVTTLSVSTDSVNYYTAFIVRDDGTGILINDGVSNVAQSEVCAQLEIRTESRGVLFPRLTTAQKNAIASPLAGLVVFDTTLNKLCIRTSAAWETITSI